MRGPGKNQDKAGDDRAARLAEALRDNLRRRKSQGRARRAAAETGGAETGGAERGTDGATGGRRGGGPVGRAQDGRDE